MNKLSKLTSVPFPALESAVASQCDLIYTFHSLFFKGFQLHMKREVHEMCQDSQTL